jgi:hypothetical protein
MLHAVCSGPAFHDSDFVLGRPLAVSGRPLLQSVAAIWRSMAIHCPVPQFIVPRSSFIATWGGLVGRGAGLGQVLVQLQHQLDERDDLAVAGFVGFIIWGLSPFAPFANKITFSGRKRLTMRRASLSILARVTSKWRPFFFTTIL